MLEAQAAVCHKGSNGFSIHGIDSQEPKIWSNVICKIESCNVRAGCVTTMQNPLLFRTRDAGISPWEDGQLRRPKTQLNDGKELLIWPYLFNRSGPPVSFQLQGLPAARIG